MFSSMNNKRLNLAIIDQIWQTSVEACPIWCIHDCGGGGGARNALLLEVCM
jgi:hypothetical protein